MPYLTGIRPTMRRLSALAVVAWVATPGPGLTQEVSLSGTVTGTGGLLLPEATVRVVNGATGEEVRVYSSTDGRYRFESLAAGSYSVSAAMPCCSFLEHTEEDVAIVAGVSTGLDIELQETLVILGDDPALYNYQMRARQDLPDDPVPRDSTGRPDLTGVWFHSMDPLQDAPAALPWAEELAQQRIASIFRDHPHNECLPGDVYQPGAAAFMLKLVQTPELLVILFEDVPGFRQVFLDGRERPDYLSPTWMGHSIGRWEGDTLVIETVGLNDRGWNDAFPRSEQMRLEERFTRSEYGVVDVLVTIEDPEVFERPWVRRMRFDLAPQEELFEYVCETNKWRPDDAN